MTALFGGRHEAGRASPETPADRQQFEVVVIRCGAEESRNGHRSFSPQAETHITHR